MTHEIIEGDCLEVLPTLAEGSVDCVVTDPPYPCIKRAYGYWTEEEWWALMRPVVAEVRRILKPKGSAVFVLQSNQEKVGSERAWLWEFMAWIARDWNMVQDAWWWNISALPTAGGNTQGLLKDSLKACVWGGAPDCWRDQAKVRWLESDGSKGRRQYRRFAREVHPSGNVVDGKRLATAPLRRGGVTPFDVLPVPNSNPTTSAGAHGHCAGTPEPLCNWWLRYICPPDGTVLDPFAGSGTTLVAAAKLGLSGIGIEREAEYVEIARRRVAEATRQTTLAL